MHHDDADRDRPSPDLKPRALGRRQVIYGAGAALALAACDPGGADDAGARRDGGGGSPPDGGAFDGGAVGADGGSGDGGADAGPGVDGGDADAGATDAGAPTGPIQVDETAADAAGLRARLMAWAADWAGTVPAGKSASDERVLGLTAPVMGAVDLSGLSFPQRVCVRAVGGFSDDYTCSTYIQGTVNMSGSTRLWLCLMDVRAPGMGLFATGLVNLDRTTDCGVLRCSFSGWPFTITPGATGTTAYAISPNGATRLTVKHNVYRYFSDGFAKWRGQMDDLRLEGNMGLYSGGDDYTAAAGNILNDPIIVANYFDRHHAKAAGVHNDGWQQNGNGGGSEMNRFTLRYNVGYRGTWTGTGATRENGWQLWFMSGAGRPSTGPWLAEHCMFLNGQQRGIDRIPGAGTLTVRYCAAIDSDVDASQVANARFPRILNADVRERNFVTSSRVGYTDGAGTNGIDVLIGTAPDHTPLLAYMESVPTDTTDLWDIRPRVGTRYHPDYSPAADRVGPFDLWAKLLAGDPEVVLSRVGWPVAPLFVADFDRGDNFWGGYTGRFDADGDNA